MKSWIIAGNTVKKRIKKEAREGKKGKFSKYDFGHLEILTGLKIFKLALLSKAITVAKAHIGNEVFIIELE